MSTDADLFGHRTVTPDATATFAAITADYSRIHVDHHLGAATPAGRGFAHGLLGASWALGALSRFHPERVGCGSPGDLVSGFSVRFEDIVHFGDTLAVRTADAPPGDDAPAGSRTSSFQVENHDGATPARGHVVVSHLDALPSPRPAPWPGGEWVPPSDPTPMEGGDLLERGPRGSARVRTVTEADVVGYANFTGDLNPLHLDARYATDSVVGHRTAPPMLCFCLGFSSWLAELMRWPMAGGQAEAGHLGDRWTVFAPVALGDTLEVRHRPEALRRTRSQPTRGVATFGLQLVNQRDEVVQHAEVDIMVPMGTDEEGSAP